MHPYERIYIHTPSYIFIYHHIASCTFVYIHILPFTFIYHHILSYIHTYIHIYIHTYIHTLLSSPQKGFSVIILTIKKLQTYNIHLLKFKRVPYLQDIGKMLQYVLNIINRHYHIHYTIYCQMDSLHPYAFIYIHVPSYTFTHFHIHSYPTIYIHIPSYTFISCHMDSYTSIQLHIHSYTVI